ncbi:DUF1648 domain-containing protein [Flavobacterium wongokense]|uniref:DUF1648 domain-containing protein n=1 Tax=Flavobacterium wongokense TaxID=2910674 RepID=UPI001F2D5A7A|nr:DUF1648 domain-containing protein [Flavobacterium sp. WG47]MCF6132216.1 DUF1648 domain-containing protein [Flavobacterium sp. WG47]
MPENSNPIIETPITLAGKIMEFAGVLLLIAFWVYTLSHFEQLPDIIPTHFRTNGDIDGYGSKWSIIFLPIVGTLMYLGLTVVRYPHKMNYLVTITEANAKKQYLIVISMFRMLKMAIVIVFFLIAFETIQLAMGFPDVLGKWFLLLVTALVMGPVFCYLIIPSKNA